MTLLARFTNEDDGIESHVYRNAKGYNVALMDTDANKYLPTVAIYPADMENAFDKALEKARELVQ